MERNNRIFNNSVRSFDQTYNLCLTFISQWLNLLLGTSREMARQTLKQAQIGEVSDSLLKETHREGRDGNNSDVM